MKLTVSLLGLCFHFPLHHWLEVVPVVLELAEQQEGHVQVAAIKTKIVVFNEMWGVH